MRSKAPAGLVHCPTKKVEKEGLIRKQMQPLNVNSCWGSDFGGKKGRQGD
jgi:hypothetical protein